MDINMILDLKANLNDIVGLLYKGRTNEGIASMTNVIGSLAAICEMIDSEELRGRILINALAPALEAMNDGDGILLADIINYELITILDELV